MALCSSDTDLVPLHVPGKGEEVRSEDWSHYSPEIAPAPAPAPAPADHPGDYPGDYHFLCKVTTGLLGMLD